MKYQVRNNVFETNSSSCHAICIPKNKKYKKGEEIYFGHDEFGWESGERYNTEDYLHEMIHAVYRDNPKEIEDKVSYILKSHGIECEWEEDKGWDGYIDHGYLCRELIERLLSDEELLLTFLFGDSYIITGNDNDESYCDAMYDVVGYEETEWGTFPEYYESYKEKFDDYLIYEKGN